ncbi:MAG: head GIN domain-containing protein [Saprospiraceae bacterium]
MKKQFIFLLVSMLAIFTMPTCIIEGDGPFWDCESGTGPEVEAVLDVPFFTGVRLEANARVFITQGDNFEVVAKGDENIINLLQLDVQNNTWTIEFSHCVNNYDLEIYITMPEIDLLSISGSGEMVGENFFDTEDIVLRISGSGNICLGLFSETIDGKISGSGEIELEGTAEFLDFAISGSGDLKAFPLIASKADISISGSGDAAVHVLEILDVSISGSGNVFYKGHPILNVTISGSGDVIDAN